MVEKVNDITAAERTFHARRGRDATNEEIALELEVSGVGLAGQTSQTLEEIGRHFNLTRERIRQIEGKTLSKLRHPSRSASLRDYLDD